MVFRTLRIVALTVLALAAPMALAQVNGVPVNPGLYEPAIGRLNLRVGPITTAERPNILTMDRRDGRDVDLSVPHVLQLDGPMTPARRAALEQMGVVLGDYLPTFAYLVRLDAADLNQVAASGFVIWAGAFETAWKIDPEVGQRVYVTAQRQAIAAQGEVVVEATLFSGMETQEAVAAIRALPGAHVYRAEDQGDVHVVRVRLPLNTVPQLAALRQVQFIEEFGEVTLRNDSNRWIVQSNVLNVTPLYNAGLRGEGQVVGILDSRVNISHCSFIDSANSIGPNHRKIVAYNTSTGYGQHGTHVAGTAVGDGGTWSHTRGVAYMGKLVFNLIPSLNETAVYNSLTTHHNQGARVHTNSWGNDGTTSYDGLCRGIDRFARDNEDSLVLLAVTNTSTLKNPENAKNLLAVGASQDTPNQANHCSGGTGPTADSRRKPEIYAPGCSTNSSSGSGTVCTTAALTGTSMATPAVAGAGMLVRQYFTEGFYPTGSAVSGNAFIPTGTLVKATLLNSAVDMTGIAGYPSNLEGWGRVLADEALYFAGETRRLIVHDVRHAQGLSTGQQTEYGFNVTGSSQRLKITLVWTEPAGTAGASNPVVNDLDLEVVGPGGTYLGNVFSGGQSVTGGVKDAKNNVEQVHLQSPPIGAYTVRVRGAAVNQSTQGYALVISGEVGTGIPAPANDLCANAATAGPGSAAFTTVGATTDGPNEPTGCTFGGYSHIENDVWFKVAAACTGQMTVSLCGASFDAKMAVYGACPTASGQTLACNDNHCGLAPQVTFPVTAGTVYRVRIGGFQGATGTGTMTITCVAACPADITPPGGDGQVNVNDLLAVINAWGACPVPPAFCIADISPPGGDGVVNVNDLLAVINAWGQCP